jgi:transcriptional regulator with XRE-family HTH domain
MDAIKSTIKTIKSQRLRHGLTQECCARGIGISQQNWGRYEKGQRVPDFVTLQKMGRAVGLFVSINVTSAIDRGTKRGRSEN